MNARLAISVAAVATLISSAAATAGHAASRDADGDGIPNRWERAHDMNPLRAVDATRDYDQDRLTNLREYRIGTLIRDEDTDNDGHDDGDEVRDDYRSTDVEDSDTDDDGVRDGDEDADRDGVDNEDEDDAKEVCARDDDDRDDDGIEDEDENDFGLKVGSADSDDDGIGDGDEDFDENGEANEDDDDALDDSCDGDRDDDGEDDEDEGDLLGTISSFDSGSGTLVVTVADGNTVTGVVTDETEIDFAEADGGDSEGDDSEDHAEFEDREATAADLAPGVQVAELEFEDEPGVLDEVEIYQSQP